MAQPVKDLALSLQQRGVLLWTGFIAWCRDCHMLCMQQGWRRGKNLGGQDDGDLGCWMLTVDVEGLTVSMESKDSIKVADGEGMKTLLLLPA